MAVEDDGGVAEPKERLSVSIDVELAETARRAVAAGRADSISGWVLEAMRRQVDHDARLQALDVFIAEFEAEHGSFTDEEVRAAPRAVISRAAV